MCRTAVSVWMATHLGNSSTAYSALAVSATCQTTTAAISIGLPSASFTFATAVSWLRSRTDTFRRFVNGFTNTSPASRTVPWYRPNSCTTRGSPATTGTRPDSTSPAATSRMVAHPPAIPLPLLRVRADISSPMPTHRPTRPATRAKTPGTDQALCSASCAVAGLCVMAGGCMPIAGHLLLTCLTISIYHTDIILARRAAGVAGSNRAGTAGNGAPGSFTGKLAVVTGGGSGMGRELVRQLAARGCSVAACDWHADTVAETAALAQAGAPPGVRVTGHACDVGEEAQVLRFRDEVAGRNRARATQSERSLAGQGDQLVPLSPGQAGQHQVVGMIDEFQHLLLRHRTVESHGVPVPLVEVVAGGDGRITAAQVGRQAGIALEADAARCRAQRHQREHLPGDLEDGHFITERVVLG